MFCYCSDFPGKSFDDPLVLFGDIAVPTGLGNADPCTDRGCLWPKSTDGNVYIPFRISNQYCEFRTLFFITAEVLQFETENMSLIWHTQYFWL